MTTEKYLTVVQLAERWHLHKKSLGNWRVKGTGPAFIKIGKKVLYSLAVIEAWEKNITQKSTVG